MGAPTKFERYKKEHPEATPYDALVAGEISQIQYENLMRKKDPASDPEPEQNPEPEKFYELGGGLLEPPKPLPPAERPKAQPQVTILNSNEPVRAAPKLTSLKTPASNMGVLFNKITGRKKRMSMVIINKMVKKYPNMYEKR